MLGAHFCQLCWLGFASGGKGCCLHLDLHHSPLKPRSTVQRAATFLGTQIHHWPMRKLKHLACMHTAGMPASDEAHIGVSAFWYVAFQPRSCAFLCGPWHAVHGCSWGHSLNCWCFGAVEAHVRQVWLAIRSTTGSSPADLVIVPTRRISGRIRSATHCGIVQLPRQC